MSIDKLAKFHLSLYYGDKYKCLRYLKNTMVRYQNCVNSESIKIKSRIEKYKSLINYLENDRN